jgi:eukaryotic-like serine/threonine-protein kinase
MTDAETTTNPEDPLVGTTIDGKYRVVRLCGRGGMGSVYEALNAAIGKKVALKFLDRTGPNPEAVQRLVREAQAASAAESLHIVQVFDVGQLSGHGSYIVMELLQGENLAQRLAGCRRLPVSEALQVAVHTLRGLRKAHEAGIVHRDLKPENIFLVETGDEPIFAKVLDFGVSKILKPIGEAEPGSLTRDGVVLGTPFYMAPEQAQGAADLDERVDLWAVGAILYECLAGQRPFSGKNYEQVIVSICTRDPPDLRSLAPGTPQDLAEVIADALQREPGKRIPSADQFLERLRKVAPDLISSSASGNRVARPVAVHGPVEADAGSGARPKVSWSSTDGRPVVRLPRGKSAGRGRLALLGAAVMLGAFALTFALAHRRHVQRESGPVLSAPSPRTRASAAIVELRIVPTPSTALVFVDDQPAPDKVVRGAAGASVRVRVQAEGHHPSERTVVLAAPSREQVVVLDPAAEADAAEPKPARPTAIARPGTQPASSAKGIAGGLKLKTEGP